MANSLLPPDMINPPCPAPGEALETGALQRRSVLQAFAALTALPLVACGGGGSEAAVTAENTPLTPTPAAASSPAPASAPPAPGARTLVARGSNIVTHNYDNGLIDTLDMRRALAPVPWSTFIDGNQTIGHALEGRTPAGFRALSLFGQTNTLYDAVAVERHGVVVQVDPNFGEHWESIIRDLKTYPLSAGPRERALMTPYTVWHGHTRRQADGTIATSPRIPLAIGATMDGHWSYAMRDGSIQLPFSTPVESWLSDFTFHEPRIPRVTFFTDVQVGRLMRCDLVGDVPTVRLLAAGFKHCTSVRSVKGLLYVADPEAGEVWEVHPDTGAKRLVAKLPGAFWIDYFSDGDLLVMANTRALHRVTRAGVVGANFQPPANLVPKQQWVQCDVDRNGTCGPVDGIVAISVTGNQNTDFWRFDKHGSLLPMFEHSYGTLTVGPVIHVTDPIGHYPWTAVHHPDEPLLFVQGFAAAQLSALQAIHPDHPVVNKGSFDQYYGDYERALRIIERGCDDGDDATKVPSLTAQINRNGGSMLGCSSDAIAELSPADQVAFVRRGMLGSYPRKLSKEGMRALLHYLNANSQKGGLRVGWPAIKAMRDYVDQHYDPNA